MYGVRGESESSSDSNASSELSESETSDVNDSSSDDFGNLDAGIAVTEGRKVTF